MNISEKTKKEKGQKSANQGNEVRQRRNDKQTMKERKKRRQERQYCKNKIKRENKRHRQERREQLKREQKRQKTLDSERQSIGLQERQIFGWLAPTQINAIAIASGYTKKYNEKLIPMSFLLTMAFASFGDGSITYSLLATKIFEWFVIEITPQAICKRCSVGKTVRFLENVFVEALKQQLSYCFNGMYTEVFYMFTDVIIEDSTQIRLHKRVGKSFKGCGGAASTSAMKLNVSLSVKHHNVRNIDIASGAVSDQSFPKTTRKYIRRGELWIRDLGYFDITDMSIIDRLRAFFLSRLKKDINVYLNYEDANPVNICEFIETRTKNGQTLDQVVYIGQKRLRVRLLGEKVPEKIRDQRVNRYEKEKIKRDKNKTMKKDYVEWFSYSVFVTNIPDSMISSPSVLMAVYKIRWQIELFFKRIKSILQIHIIKGESKHKVLCLIYAKLISLLTAQKIISYAVSICDKDEELSEHKLLKWLKDGHRLGNVIIKGQIAEFFETLIRIRHLFCKNKRRKRSTQQIIRDAFLEDALSGYDENCGTI